jgi:amidase
MTKISKHPAPTLNLEVWNPSFEKDRHTPRFDVLTVTAHNLQHELIAGRLQSTQILEEYHRSICEHNGYLNAVFALAPGAMKRAQEMDARRTKGKFLGPLHGIPILIKVCIS